MKITARIFVALLVCFLLSLPFTALAKTYTPSDSNVSIQIDDTLWYVFTTDNLENNPELEELGLTAEDIRATFTEYNAYIDAALFYENGDYIEFFCRKNDLDIDIVNLSNYSDDEVLELAEGIALEKGAEDFDIHKSQYKFTKMEYIEEGFSVFELVTIVNNQTYVFTFQSTAPFTAEEYVEMEGIINSITFDVDPTLQEKNGDSSILTSAIIGGVVGGGAGAIVAYIKKKSKKGAEAAKAAAQEPAVWACANCNTQNLSTSDVCWSCGAKRP